MAGDLDDFERDFEGWVRPADALIMLDVVDDKRVCREISRRLSDGLITAVAETHVSAGSSTRWVTIRKEAWGRTAIDEPWRDFWISGTVEFERGYSAAGPTASRCYNVRFPPDEFGKVVALLTGKSVIKAPVSVEPHPDLKPLAVADQRRFCELLVGIYGSDAATESFARRAVAALHPDRQVSRDGFREILRKVRELNGPVKVGRPSARGE